MGVLITDSHTAIPRRFAQELPVSLSAMQVSRGLEIIAENRIFSAGSLNFLKFFQNY